MDSINKKIIKKLHENSRISISDLSKFVHLSAPAVKERIEKLEEQGVIEQYTVKLNTEKLGLAVTGFVYANVFIGKEADFVSALKLNSAVSDCFNVTGEKGFIFKISVKNMSELDHLLESISHLCKTDTSLILNNVISSRLVELDKE